MKELSQIIALMSSSLESEAKVRMLREVYTSLCEHMEEQGFKVARKHSIEVASSEVVRFFKTEGGAHAAFKMIQMIAALSASREEIKDQIEEQEEQEDRVPDYSRN